MRWIVAIAIFIGVSIALAIILNLINVRGATAGLLDLAVSAWAAIAYLRRTRRRPRPEGQLPRAPGDHPE